MTRAIAFLLLFIPVSLYNVVKPDELAIEISTVESVSPGDSFEATYHFVRGDIKGFGRLQHTFPSGIEVEAVETADATFTFDNDIMKVIWLNLPKDKEFDVKVKITVAESYKEETLEIGGRLSYLEKNDRKSYTCLPTSIKVLQPEILAAQAEAEEEASKVEVYSANRTITPLGNDIYEVAISINKSGFTGFGKIEEKLSLGAEAEIIEGQKAVFTFIKDKAKFVWMAIPETETLDVKYKLDLSGAMIKDINSITGTFSFLDNDQTKTSEITTLSAEELLAQGNESDEAEDEANATSEEDNNTSTEDADIEQEEDQNSDNTSDNGSTSTEETANAEEEETEDEEEATTAITEEIAAAQPETTTAAEEQEESTTTNEEEETTTESTNSTEDNTSEDVVTETATANNNNDITPSSDDLTPSEGISYRVQIAAGKNVVDKPYFVKKHNFNEAFFVDNHEGWVKYTTGQFDVYKAARDKREVINNAGHKFDGPFVTAYNNGERITVQEALMVSKQQWFK